MKESKTHINHLLENISARDDQRSFEELFRLFYERLLNFCMRYTMAREIAEELVSDALFTIWEKRKDLSHVQNMETYLFVMVKNKSINYTKQFSNYRYVYLEESGGHELININDPGKELERRELMLKMDKAIEKLPRQCKIIFSLVKEEGLKYKDVAQILDISPRTVETQLVRALKKLDKVLNSYGFHKSSRKRKSNSFSTLRSMMFSIFC